MIDLGPHNTGFRMDFPNGWTVSVQFGKCNYCENSHTTANLHGGRYLSADSAEVAAYKTASNGWYRFKCLPDSGDDVYSNVSPDQIAAAIAEVAALPPLEGHSS